MYFSVTPLCSAFQFGQSKNILISGCPGLSCIVAGWKIFDLLDFHLNFTDEKSTLIQVMSWTNVDLDLCHYMMSLGHNESNESKLIKLSIVMLIGHLQCLDFHSMTWGNTKRDLIKLPKSDVITDYTYFLSLENDYIVLLQTTTRMCHLLRNSNSWCT